MSETTPTLGEALAFILDERLARVHTCMLGKVESYNATTRTATVQPQVRQAHIDEEGKRVAPKMPALAHVPVLFNGTRKSAVTFDIERGDPVLLLFCEGSIDRFATTGSEGDPADDRRHHIGDAVAIPVFFRPSSSPAAEAGGAVIHIDSDGVVHLGSAGATKGVARTGDGVSVSRTELVACLTGIFSLQVPSTPNPLKTSADGTVTGGSGTVKAKD